MDSKKRKTHSSARKKPPLKALEQKDKEQEAQAAAKLIEENSDKTEASPNRAENSSPEPNCSICLGHLQNKSFTDSCFHMFCFVCIQEWSKVKAECPLCKQKFTSIIHNVRSYEDYDQYPIPQKNPAWEETESRNFRYRTTLTFERSLMIGPGYVPRQHQEHDYTLQRPTQSVTTRSSWRQRRQRATTDFRRRIYINGLRVTDTKNRRLRTRMITPEFFRRNDACSHRLVPWLNRELNALLFNHQEHVQFVLELILGMIKNYPISSEEFYQHVYPYVGRHTRHFMHEFENFAKSPFNMAAYDQHAVYQPHAVTVESDSEVESISSDENEGNNDDVIFISPTQDRPSEPSEPRISITSNTSDSTMNYVQNRAEEDRMTYEDLSPLLTRVRNFLSADMLANHGTSTSGWDSPTPGPSWLIDSEVPAAEQSAVEQHIPQELKTPSAVKTETVKTSKPHTSCSDSSTDSYSDSSDGSDLMFVGYEKPWQERSPIVLSSDSDDAIISIEHQKSKRCKKMMMKSGHRDRRRDRSHSRHREDYTKRHRSHDHGQSHSRRYRSRSRSRSLSRRERRHDRRHERSRSRHRSRGSYRSNSREGHRSRHRSPFSRDRSRSSTSSNHRHHSSSHQRKRHRSRSDSIEIVDYQRSKHRRKEKKMHHKKHKHKKHKKHTRHSSPPKTQAYEQPSGHQVRSQVVVVDKPELEKVTSESDEEVLIDVVYCSDTNEQNSSKICTTDVEKSENTSKTLCSETENIPLADKKVENEIEQKLDTLDTELPNSDISAAESSAVISESSKSYKKHPSGHKKSSSKSFDIQNSLSHKKIEVSGKRNCDKEFKEGDKDPSRNLDASKPTTNENDLSGNVDISESREGVNPSGELETWLSKSEENNLSLVSREGVNNPSGKENTSVNTSLLTSTSVNTSLLASTSVNTSLLASTSVNTSLLASTSVNTSLLASTSVNTSLLTSSISESCKSMVSVSNTSDVDTSSTSVIKDKSSISSSDELNTNNNSDEMSTSGKCESFVLSANIVGENSTNNMDCISDDSSKHDSGSSLDHSVSNNQKIRNSNMPNASFSNEAVSRGNSKDSIDYLEILGEDEKDSNACITTSSLSTFFHNTALSSKNSAKNIKDMHKSLDWYRVNLAARLASSRQKSVSNDEVTVDVHSDSDTNDAVDTEIRRSLFPSLEHLSRHFMQPYSFNPSKGYSCRGQKQSPIEIEESSSSDNSDVDVGDNSSFVLPGASHEGNMCLSSCVNSSRSPYAMSQGSTKTHPVILHSDADNSSDSDDCTVTGHTDSPAKFDYDCSVTGYTNSRARIDDDCTITGHTDSPAKYDDNCDITGHTDSPAKYDDNCDITGHTDSPAKFEDDLDITGNTDSPAKYDDNCDITGHTDSQAKSEDGSSDALTRQSEDCIGHLDSSARFGEVLRKNSNDLGTNFCKKLESVNVKNINITDAVQNSIENQETVRTYAQKWDEKSVGEGQTKTSVTDNKLKGGSVVPISTPNNHSSSTDRDSESSEHGTQVKYIDECSETLNNCLETDNAGKIGPRLNVPTSPQLQPHMQANEPEKDIDLVNTISWTGGDSLQQNQVMHSDNENKMLESTKTLNNFNTRENMCKRVLQQVTVPDLCTENETLMLEPSLQKSSSDDLEKCISLPCQTYTTDRGPENHRFHSHRLTKPDTFVTHRLTKPDRIAESTNMSSQNQTDSIHTGSQNQTEYAESTNMSSQNQTESIHTGSQNQTEYAESTNMSSQNQTDSIHTVSQNQREFAESTNTVSQNQTDSIHTVSQSQTEFSESAKMGSQNQTHCIHTGSQSQTEYAECTSTVSRNLTDFAQTCSQNQAEPIESTNTFSQNQTHGIHTGSQSQTEFAETTNTFSQNQTESIDPSS